MNNLNRIKQVMHAQGNTDGQISLFAKLFNKYRKPDQETLDWQTVKAPNGDKCLQHDQMVEPEKEEIKELLSSLAVCKLNGGLGTSMGCVGPKSAIEVRDGKSFLDLIVTQIKSLNDKNESQVPLILMNSFNTNQDTQKIINRYEDEVKIETFQQNEFPRIRRDTLLPMSKGVHGNEATYPPGHGDFYQSLSDSGILDSLLKDGREIMFVANSDNLGATVDLKILNYMKENNIPFIMELTAKTRADVKGGTLIENQDSSLKLLEIAQVPEDYVEDFKSVKKFKIFNTNNIWINLKALKEKLKEGPLELDVIINQKVVNHQPIVQLETAIGAGISHFPKAKCVVVERSRFLPVKKTDDLLMVQSNLFTLKEGALTRNPERQFEGLPLIRLGENFKHVEEYKKRFKSIPDILELDLLTVVGNVTFEKDITMRGNVILVCEGSELRVPRNSLLVNKVLTGSIKMGEL